MVFHKIIILFIVYVCLLLNTGDASDGYYTIVGSKYLRPNFDYNVAITAQGYKEPIEMCVGIKGRSSQYDTSRNVSVKPGATEIIPLRFDGTPTDSYRLYAKGLNGVSFENITDLEYKPKSLGIHIQTDKGIYKPGDTVRFRVIFLDNELKVADFKDEVEIYLMDSKGNRIKYWKNVVVNNGVFSSETVLSELLNLGKWTIKVNVAGMKEEKSFDIDEYVLPRYEVAVQAQRELYYYDDNKIPITIRATYTHGQTVKGTVSLRISIKDGVGKEKNSDHPEILKEGIPIDGKAVIDFDINNELKYDIKHSIRDIKFEATVTEESSGHQLKGSTVSTGYYRKFSVELNYDKPNIKPGLPVTGWIVVKNRDGSPVRDTLTPLNISIFEFYSGEVPFSALPNGNRPRREQIYLSENGTARINFELTSAFEFQKQISAIEYFAFYRDSSNSKVLRKMRSDATEFLSAAILTENPKLGHEVDVEVRASNSLKYLIYQVSGRDGVVESNTMEIPGENLIRFKFMVSQSMIPKAYIIVYYIGDDGEMISDRAEISISASFKNSVAISLSKPETRPGEELDITVKTNENSYVGLLGIDQSVLLLKSGNDFDKDEILRSVQNKEVTSDDDASFRDFMDSGAVIMSNSHVKTKPLPPIIYQTVSLASASFSSAMFSTHSVSVHSDHSGGLIEPVEEPVTFSTRSSFPETWIWEDFNSGNGTQTLRKKVPDTITSWIISGFSLDPISGFGMTLNSEKLQVFQPFFVSIELPYSIKRGEIITLPAIVFNYLNEMVEAEVSLNNALNEFDFVELSGSQPQKISIKPNNGVAVPFTIRAKNNGYVTINVVATSKFAGDAIERQLLVEPEGVTEFVNKATLIDLNESSEFSTDILIEIPENVVPDSTRIQFSAIGDLLGTTVENLDKLIRLPTGCGEQNMINFVPTIMIMEYLNATNKLDDVVRRKLVRNMEIGYQRELTYKHRDGSFSAWGPPGSRNGSTWLTAFVAKSFKRAVKYIEIGDVLIENAFDYLASIQAEDGSFPERGVVVDKHLQGGVESSKTLTAYVVTAFSELPLDEMMRYGDNIKKALDYLTENLSDDSYTLALTSYALQLTRGHYVSPKVKADVLQRLNNKATENGDMKWWEGQTAPKESYFLLSSRPSTVNVELSSYGLLANLEANSMMNALAVMKWLLTQRNENGGFTSTQDTVVGIQALADVASRLAVSKHNIDITADYDEGKMATIKLNSETENVLQSHEIPPSTRLLKIRATGQGLGLMQISYRYNIDNSIDKPRFKLDVDVPKKKETDDLILKVCVNYLSATETNDLDSNMAVVEVKLPSGYSMDSEKLKELKRTPDVRKVETKEGDSIVVLYYDSLGEEVRCTMISAFKRFDVVDQKPAWAVVYDYYDNSRRARIFYSI